MSQESWRGGKTKAREGRSEGGRVIAIFCWDTQRKSLRRRERRGGEGGGGTERQ